MATKTKSPTVVVEETNGKHEQNALYDGLRKVLLASIGAVALAQDEIEDFVDRLIERGEIAEKDGRKLVREVFEKRKKEAQKAEDEFSKRVESTLDRMSVPSKSDIEALSEKITELSKKIDELKKV
jgi:poly(hydroxyalkanoate) granule-associated protein